MKNLMINDSDYKQALDEIGFCILPLFSPAQIEQIKAVYQTYFTGNKVAGLIASHSKTGPELSLHVSASLKDIVMPSLEKQFSDFIFFLGGFMVKQANTSSEFPLHQDWNIVDETKFTSYQIWIPLELSSPDNGGIFVLPGSHRFFENNRSGSYGMPRIDTDETMRKLSVDMIIPPGSALVYHNSLFHASYPNHTNADRISAIINIYQKDAVLEYAHKNVTQNRTEKYSIDTTSFLTHLNTFEKGNVPTELTEFNADKIDTLDNAKVKSADMAVAYQKMFTEDFAPLQLHILKDVELEKKMNNDGFAVIDFVDEETVEELKAAYLKDFNDKQTNTGRFTTLEHATPDIRRHFHETIIQKCQKPLQMYFRNYNIPIASYFVKYSNSKGDLDWHQDSSLLLNAHLEPHYAVWCPLVAVDANNGALCVIKGSHRFNSTIILHDLPWPYAELSSLFERKKEILCLKPGQAVLFDIRLVHHATPNFTNEDRLCFTFRITHEKSKYYNMVCDTEEKNTVSVYQVAHDYYLTDKWNTGVKPLLGNKAGELRNVHAKINLKNVRNMVTEDSSIAI